jgi:F0F1-type ATP synthase beta subunit
MAQAQGTIVQCIGAVTDIQFSRDSMPNIYEALLLVDDPNNKLVEKDLTFEVEQQLGDGVVRCIALGSSDGLRRGMKVTATGGPISVPVGKGTLGRIMNVLGRPIDDVGPIKSDKKRSIHQIAPKFDELSPSVELLETGHQGDRPHLPVLQGRQDRSLRRRRRGQDGEHAGADQQHRHSALGPVGVRRRGREARAKATTSITR